MCAPDLETYYKAAMSSHTYHWMHPAHVLPHVLVERDMARPTPLTSLLCKSPTRLYNKFDSLNSAVYSFRRLTRMPGEQLLYSPLLQVERCTWFTLGQETAALRAFHSLGIRTMGDFFQDGAVKQWEQVLDNMETPSALLHFHYFRARHQFKDILGTEMREPEETLALTHMIRMVRPRRLIALLYQYSQLARTNVELKVKIDWQDELNVIITEKQWLYCCSAIQKVSFNSRHRLLHFKFLHRMYYTPLRLHKLGLRGDSYCQRCGEGEAGFLHLAWSCPPIYSYWSQVLEVMHRMIGEDIDWSPLIVLLGCVMDLPRHCRRLVALGLVVAKRRLAMRWMRGPIPTLREWQTDMLYCNTQTDTYREMMPIHGAPKDFWGPISGIFATLTRCDWFRGTTDDTF